LRKSPTHPPCFAPEYRRYAATPPEYRRLRNYAAGVPSAPLLRARPTGRFASRPPGLPVSRHRRAATASLLNGRAGVPSLPYPRAGVPSRGATCAEIRRPPQRPSGVRGCAARLALYGGRLAPPRSPGGRKNARVRAPTTPPSVLSRRASLSMFSRPRASRSVPSVRGVVLAARFPVHAPNKRFTAGNQNHNPSRTPLRLAGRVGSRSVPFRVGCAWFPLPGTSPYYKQQAIDGQRKPHHTRHYTPLRSGSWQARRRARRGCPQRVGSTLRPRLVSGDHAINPPPQVILQRPGSGVRGAPGVPAFWKASTPSAALAPPPYPLCRPPVSDSAPLHSASPPRAPPSLALVVASFCPPSYLTGFVSSFCPTNYKHTPKERRRVSGLAPFRSVIAAILEQ